MCNFAWHEAQRKSANNVTRSPEDAQDWNALHGMADHHGSSISASFQLHTSDPFRIHLQACLGPEDAVISDASHGCRTESCVRQ